jgi:hypothetical protein
MRLPNVLLAFFSAAVFATVACQSEPRTEMLDDTQKEGSSQLLPGYEQTINGDIGSVNLEARTFTLKSADVSETFSFNDDTQVTGATGTQGLAGKEGARATVHYRDNSGTKVATQIILE